MGRSLSVYTQGGKVMPRYAVTFVNTYTIEDTNEYDAIDRAELWGRLRDQEVIIEEDYNN